MILKFEHQGNHGTIEVDERIESKDLEKLVFQLQSRSFIKWLDRGFNGSAEDVTVEPDKKISEWSSKWKYIMERFNQVSGMFSRVYRSMGNTFGSLFQFLLCLTVRINSAPLSFCNSSCKSSIQRKSSNNWLLSKPVGPGSDAEMTTKISVPQSRLFLIVFQIYFSRINKVDTSVISSSIWTVNSTCSIADLCLSIGMVRRWVLKCSFLLAAGIVTPCHPSHCGTLWTGSTGVWMPVTHPGCTLHRSIGAVRVLSRGSLAK